MPARMNARGLHCKLYQQNKKNKMLVLDRLSNPFEVGSRRAFLQLRLSVRHQTSADFILPGCHYISHTALHRCMEIAPLLRPRSINP